MPTLFALIEIYPQEAEAENESGNKVANVTNDELTRGRRAQRLRVDDFADITIFPGVAAFQNQKPTINTAGNNNCASKLPAAPCAAMPIASGELSGAIAIIAMKSSPNIAMRTSTSTMVTQTLSMSIARKRAQKPTYRGSAAIPALLVICSSIFPSRSLISVSGSTRNQGAP